MGRLDDSADNGGDRWMKLVCVSFLLTMIKCGVQAFVHAMQTARRVNRYPVMNKNKRALCILHFFICG